MVGIVVTISPSFSLYKMVVFPAASNPTRGKQLKISIYTEGESKRWRLLWAADYITTSSSRTSHHSQDDN